MRRTIFTGKTLCLKRQLQEAFQNLHCWQRPKRLGRHGSWRAKHWFVASRMLALAWLKLQEDAGIDTVTDGEQFRIHFVHGFLEHVSGIDWDNKTKMGIRDNRYVVDVPQVTAKLSRKGSAHGEEVKFARAHTKNKLKFTIPAR